MSSIYNRSIKVLIIHVFSLAFGFISQILIARLAGAEVYGNINYYLGIINLIVWIFNFGIAFKINSKNYHIFFFTINILYFISVPIIFIILFALNINLILVFLIIVTSYFWLISFLLNGYYINIKNQHKSKLHFEVVRTAIHLILFIIFMWLEIPGIESFIYSLLISYLYSTIILFVKPKQFNVNLQLVIKNNLLLYFALLAELGSLQVIKVVSAHIIDAKYLGALSVAILFRFVLVGFIQPISVMLTPDITECVNNRIKSARILDTVSLINILLISPLFLFLVTNASLIKTVLGESYNSFESIFIIYLIGAFIESLTLIHQRYMLIANKVVSEIIANILFTIVTIVGAYILKDYSYGIAISISLGYIVKAFIRIIVIKIDLKLSIKIKLFHFPLAFSHILVAWLMYQIEMENLNMISTIALCALNILVLYIIDFIFITKFKLIEVENIIKRNSVSKIMGKFNYKVR
ncbi:lipopolysaccharide biosynthesis protein [Aeribacillus pallidus]|uniref:lipopolysaccharide biosynthesis protein n=1 Tax=Aeribacillus pallidus TaxID=33936 RepID=UPI003D1E1919